MAGTVLFFHGADTYRSRQKLNDLKTRYIDASLGDTNLVALDGGTLTFPDFVRQVQALPFLAKTRLVIVRDLLLAGRKDVQAEAASHLDKIPATTVLCFYEAGEPDKRTALFKRLAKEKLAGEFALLGGSALQRWVAEAVRARHLALRPEARQFLIQAAGGDLWRMNNEFDKLTAYAANLQKTEDTRLPARQGRQKTDSAPLTLAQVQELVHREDETDVFALTGAIARGRTGAALIALRVLLERGEHALRLLATIAFQYRAMIMLAEAAATGQTNPYALARTTGLKPAVIQKTLPLARAASLEPLVQQFRRILATDHAIKTGQLESTHALELLIVALAAASATISLKDVTANG